jgi:hypothetical protein
VIPYAQLRPGRGGEPLRAVAYYAQRLAVWPAGRRAVSRLLATAVNLSRGEAPPRVRADGDSGRTLRELERDGVSMLAPLASPARVRRMVDYFLQRQVVGPHGAAALEDLPPGTASAAYDLETVLGCPGLARLVNAPPVLQVAASYLGCRPTLSSLGVRWAFPTTSARPTFQSFHRDVDDWRFLKLFIYLTDVDEDCGPHTYVRGSHRSAFGVRSREYQIGQLARRYGAGSVTTVLGPRGTTFLADTIGVHRGGVVRSKPRLILQAQYSILPVYAFRYRPVAARARSLDPYTNRLLITA